MLLQDRHPCLCYDLVDDVTHYQGDLPYSKVRLYT